MYSPLSIVLRENVSSIASGGQITETEAIPLWNSWSTESTSLQVSDHHHYYSCGR